MKRLLLNLLWPVFACSLSAQVTGVSPQPFTCDTAWGANIVVTLAAPASNPVIRVHTRQRGKLPGTTYAAGSTWVFDPASDFLPGEEVEVSVPAYNYTWRFSARTKAVTPLFGHYMRQYNTQPQTGDPHAIRCGDMNGDGHIDIVVGLLNGPNHIYFNDGAGNFPTSVSWGGATDQVQDLALADVDGDGDLDIAVAILPGRNMLYLNNGSGQFGAPIYLSATATDTVAVAVGDLDGDGDLDIVFANGGISALADEIYYNNGNGQSWTAGIIDMFPGSNAPMAHNSWDIALGDMNGDGSLDIVMAVFELFGSARSVIYFNDGNGMFTQLKLVGTTLVETYKFFGYADQNMSVAVGDLDGDGDLDIALGTNGGTVSDPRLACLWQNDGTGSMTLYGQTGMFTSEYDQTWHCQFVDFDGDYDWDLGITNSNYVPTGMFGGSWRTQTLCNTGGGAYVNGYGVGNLVDTHYAMDYADIDGDGDLDMILYNWLHLNGSTPPAINVQFDGNWINHGDTVNVAYNSTLASKGLWLLVSDADSTHLSLDGTVSNITSQGILDSEFSSASAAVPYHLFPSSGVFNVAQLTHTVQLLADDGYSQSAFTFYIEVGAAPPPVLGVSEPAGAINYGSAASAGRDFGTQHDSAGPTRWLNIAIGNSGGSNLTISTVTLAGNDPGEFVLDTSALAGSVGPAGSTGFGVAFDPSGAGVRTATVQVFHNDPAQPNPFEFEVAGVGTTTVYAPLLVVRDDIGAIIANGDSRGFGALVVGLSAAMTIRVQNAGNADLHIGLPSLGGANASQWVLDTTVMTGTVAPGTVTMFTLTFSPQASGTLSATMTFTHDDATQATPFSLAVFGTAASGGTSSGSGGSDSKDDGGGCVTSGGGFGLLALLVLALAVLCTARSHRQGA